MSQYDNLLEITNIYQLESAIAKKQSITTELEELKEDNSKLQAKLQTEEETYLQSLGDLETQMGALRREYCNFLLFLTL